MGHLTGFVARVLGFARAERNGAHVNDVTVDGGGGNNKITDHFSAPGDDSFPLDTDYTYVSPMKQTGRYAATGYVDPINAPVAAKGEKRIYGRKADGTVAVALWLKADGSAILSNADGSAELRANGDFAINGVIIHSDGSVTMPNGLVLNGKQIAGHSHAQGADSHGDTQANTGPNL